MRIQSYIHFPDLQDLKPIDRIITLFSFIPLLFYFLVALILSVIAIFSIAHVGDVFFNMFQTKDYSSGIFNAIHAILLTIIIIELFETVIIYLHTRQIPVRALLMVGLTAMIRHALVFSIQEAQLIDLVATGIVMTVLVLGIYMLRNESKSAFPTLAAMTSHVPPEVPPEKSGESDQPSLTDISIRYISHIPVLCYIATVIFLVIIAFISVYLATEFIFTTVPLGFHESTIENAIYMIFYTIMIIGLFETVQAYLTSRQTPIYSLLVVAIAAMIRYILVFSLGGLDPAGTIAIAFLIAALLLGIHFLHNKKPKEDMKKG
jgi:uncharacterized membrane protein (DUF373 family)